MSELTDVEALIIVIFLVILSTVYGINEIKGANQRIKQLKRIRSDEPCRWSVNVILQDGNESQRKRKHQLAGNANVAESNAGNRESLSTRTRTR